MMCRLKIRKPVHHSRSCGIPQPPKRICTVMNLGGALDTEYENSGDRQLGNLPDRQRFFKE